VWVFKLALKLLLIVAAVLCLIMLVGNLWIPKAVEIALSRTFGFDATVGKSSGSLFRGRLVLENCEIRNVALKYGISNSVSVDFLAADVNMRSLMKNTVVVDELVIDVGDITVVKNSENSDSYSLPSNRILTKKSPSNDFHTAESVSDADSTGPATDSEKRKKSWLIGKFTLNLGTIHIVDGSKGSSKEFAVNYHREFSNVDSISKLKTQLLDDLGKFGISILLNAVISSISDLPGATVEKVVKLKDASLDAIDKAGDAIEKVGKEIGSGVKKLFTD
jgi:hypothetical protein